MIKIAFVALLDRAPLPKRRALKNDADWCHRLVQNSHREPIGDKTDSCQICNLARGEVSEMPPAKDKQIEYKKLTVGVMEAKSVILEPDVGSK